MDRRRAMFELYPTPRGSPTPKRRKFAFFVVHEKQKHKPRRKTKDVPLRFREKKMNGSAPEGVRTVHFP